ncbi:MAG: hypothetical protein LBD45_09305, partial [Bacteroidales bacterium]|nr:hypothetical protein [Bacteroidales bacterium]
DFAIAKKIALQNAKSEISGSIQSFFNEVNTTYFQQYGVGATPELSQKIEGMSQDIVTQVLSNIRVIDSKTLKVDKKKDDVRCFVAVEMSKKDIGKQLADGISRATKDKIDFDADQYRKIFEEAIDKE